MQYYAKFDPAKEGGFVVTFPEIPEAITQGDTEEEALEMAEDVLLVVIEHLIRNDRPLPAPKVHKGEQYRRIPLPALVAMKCELYSEFRHQKLTKTELASRMGIAKANVPRLFDPAHKSHLDQVEDALHAIGMEMRIGFRRRTPPLAHGSKRFLGKRKSKAKVA